MKKTTFLLLLLGSCAFAQYTPIPDPNFEQTLIDLGYDMVLDGQVLTDNIDDVTSLDVSSQSINDLTGIESFLALESLICSDNNLSNLNVTQNLNLINLDTRGNPLLSLDVTQNILLQNLQVWFSLMPTIDLSKNQNLILFSGRSSQLESLDFSNNPMLEQVQVRNSLIENLHLNNNPLIWALELGGNRLTSINTNNLPNLGILLCENNLLIEIDLSQNPLLSWLSASNNQLTIIDLRNGNNNQLSTLDTTNNPNLACFMVDDKNNIPSSWNVDPDTNFMETNAECDLLSNSDLNKTKFSIYPNPTSKFLNLEFSSDIKIIKTYLINTTGQITNINISNKSINISNLNTGLYFLKIETNEGIFTKKFIRK